MKLATALSERADLQRRLSVLQTRLNNNAKTQEGEAPAESPAMLLAELDSILSRLEVLITQINLTNSRTLYEGATMTELLSRRDCLSRRIGVLRAFLDQASARVDRYSRTEIKIISTVDVTELQKNLDARSKELRELDELIQGLNWTTELLT